MLSISLIVTNKWRSRPPILIVPGHGIVHRPGIGGRLVVSYQVVANWLVSHGFCKLVEPEEPPEPELVEEPVVDRQLYITENSNLDFIPPLKIDIPMENVRLINFFMTAEPTEINSAISAISLKKAQELKQLEILQWSDVVRILSDRAIEAAIKWVQTVV
jgi:hypothetical protein